VTEPVDLLAIGAHPDDVEIGCGGALILAADAGLRVAIADLTRGERATTGSAGQRDRERRRAAELLGVSQRIDVGLVDTEVAAVPAQRRAVAAVLRELRPRVVVAPAEADRHPDHAAAGRLVREACFEATLDGAGHYVARLHHYPLHHPIEPSFVVDVSAVWEQRMAAVRAYESQFAHPPGERTTVIGDPAFLELLEGRAAFYGAMIGAARGEPFACSGPLGFDMLPGLHLQPPAGPYTYRSFT
jgi:bacillithiol biosynthesis deacetylase BshB1